MSKELEALEKIKNAPTIYVGCGSDIYTRYSHECKLIENALKALDVIKNLPQEEKQILLNAIYTYTKSEEKYDLVKEVLL